MADKVKREAKENVTELTRKYVTENFDPSRVQCLILYGSSLSEGERLASDFDFLLLLDRYHPQDVLVLRKLKNTFPSEFFIDYKDQIIRKGFDNYQRGRHGTYFFAALAYGECAVGENFYLKNLNKINPRQIKRDLLFRIEEYFYRVQKHYLNSESDFDFQYVRKYVARIVFDILLFKGIVPLGSFHKIHYLDIVDMYVCDSTDFSKRLKKDLLQLFKRSDVKVVPDIIGELYQLYLVCFDEIKNDKK